MKEDLLKIINHYGVRNQLKKFNEECFELIEAVNDYEKQVEVCENMGCSRIHADFQLEHMAEEIADIQVMLDQIKYYYGIKDEDICNMMKFKIQRQLDRINNENK